MTDRTLILDPARLDRVINRMAWQILELNSKEKEFHLVGISKSGYKLAEKLLIYLKKDSLNQNGKVRVIKRCLN